MVPWKELLDVFFGRVPGCREKCDRLAADGSLEPPVWLCICLVRGKRQWLNQHSHINIRAAAIQPCDLPNNKPHIESPDHWTPVVEVYMESLLG